MWCPNPVTRSNEAVRDMSFQLYLTVSNSSSTRQLFWQQCQREKLYNTWFQKIN